jgi:hypothetical protein
MSKLNKLIEQQEQLQKKIEQLREQEAKQAEEDLQRKKFLVGEYFLGLHEGQGTIDKLANQMSDFLVRDKDRKLFGLTQKVESEV